MFGSAAPLVVADPGGGRPRRAAVSILKLLVMLVEVGAIAGLSSVHGGDDDGAAAHLLLNGERWAAAAVFAKKILILASGHRTSPSIITGVVVAIAAGFTPTCARRTVCSIGTLLAFVIVSIGHHLPAEKPRPISKRPFRTPWVPVVPIPSALAGLAC